MDTVKTADIFENVHYSIDAFESLVMYNLYYLDL